MTVTGQQWVERFAAALGVTPPAQDEMDVLLGLAGIASHASERTAAPLSAWLAGRAGVTPADAKVAAEQLASELGDQGERSSDQSPEQ